jgi:transcriptional regulator with XRE-family HTH domain
MKKLFELLNATQKGQGKLEKEIGIPNGSISQWSKGSFKPSMSALIKIADYFNVSIDYLVGREKPATIMSQMPSEITDMWKKLDEMQQAEVKGFMRGMVKTDIKKRKENT